MGAVKREQRGHVLHSDAEVVMRLRGGKSLALYDLAKVTRLRPEAVRQSLFRLKAGKLARPNGVRVGGELNKRRVQSLPILWKLTAAGERAAEAWRNRALEDLA